MDDRWGHASGGRLLLLTIVGLGLGFLWLRASGEPLPFSAWGTQRFVAAANRPARLSGVAAPEQAQSADEQQPYGNPLQASNTIITQGYAEGTHLPTATWGALDLACDSDGDGRADPAGTLGQPIYATHAGVVQTTANSYPAGNHVWVSNDAYRTGYAHLASFAVSDGQPVRRGELLGLVGATGFASGPHLDYQVWRNQNGTWVNVNPLTYGVRTAEP